MKQRLITTIVTLLCLTVFSSASYAWRTDWKAKADQMIVVSPEVKAEIAKSPDKAKLNKVVKVGQMFMKSYHGLVDSDEDLDLWWEKNLAPWTTANSDDFFNYHAFPDSDQISNYWICDHISLDEVRVTTQGYELLYQAIIASRGNLGRFGGGEFTDEEYQNTPENGDIYRERLYINHDNKVYDVKSHNQTGAAWIGKSIETAKHDLERGYKTDPSQIDGLGQNSREHRITLYSKQLNFLTQANKVCPKY